MASNPHPETRRLMSTPGRRGSGFEVLRYELEGLDRLDSLMANRTNQLR